MKLSDFDYNLPKNLIAQHPVSPRDHSRLLILSRKNNKFAHEKFYKIEKYFKKGDIIVLNNSKVIPARIYGCKKTGGRVELLLSKPKRGEENIWECILKIKNPKINSELVFDKKLKGKILKILGEGIFEIQFNINKRGFKKIFEEIGDTPLPPYISRQQNSKITKKQIRKNYQTVYADSKKEGSIAAPTAGLHFTKNLIKRLEKRGIEFEFVTLHVGLGTFKAVKTDKIEDHKMQTEYAEVNKKTIQNIIKAKKENRRIIACGTTAIRTLETVLPKYLKNSSKIKSFAREINTFIYPGYKFKIVNGIITNFHLPKTTLLMLVSAFISEDKKEGIKTLKKAYLEAINKKYRFYSFGDAMLIL
jgi:S-adenosylmethionine:tRNA ribosyltransferase-isomerase